MLRFQRLCGYWSFRFTSVWIVVVATLSATFGVVSPVFASCEGPLGDVNYDGSVGPVDVQCTILTTLASAVGGAVPDCLPLAILDADVDCNGAVTVVDVQLVIAGALGQPLSAELDGDSDGCPDSCLGTIAGNWSWQFNSFAGSFQGVLVIAHVPPAANFTALAIDAGGLATATGVVDFGAGVVEFTKNYSSGESSGSSFAYDCALVLGGPQLELDCDHVQVGVPANTGTGGGLLATAIDPALVGGVWKLNANWGNTTMNLQPTPDGWVTGTGSDVYGTATLTGALNLSNGKLFFRKVYTNGQSKGQDFWYQGTLSADGQKLIGGVWGNGSLQLNNGTWSAVR